MNDTITDEFRAAFDLTNIGDAATFREFLDHFDGSRCDTAEQSVFDSGFVWSLGSGDAYIRTYNNPLTGQHYRDLRPPDAGYASYIHLVGEEAVVRDAYRWIEDNANYTKGKSLGTWDY